MSLGERVRALGRKYRTARASLSYLGREMQQAVATLERVTRAKDESDGASAREMAKWRPGCSRGQKPARERRSTDHATLTMCSHVVACDCTQPPWSASLAMQTPVWRPRRPSAVASVQCSSRRHSTRFRRCALTRATRCAQPTPTVRGRSPQRQQHRLCRASTKQCRRVVSSWTQGRQRALSTGGEAAATPSPAM